jgi:hypothetical protein
VVWKEKWLLIITKIKKYLESLGGKAVVINIDIHLDTQKQYEIYMRTIDEMKERVEVIITTGLPDEERIFWPYGGIQFYIREEDEKVHITGNSDIVKRILN